MSKYGIVYFLRCGTPPSVFAYIGKVVKVHGNINIRGCMLIRLKKFYITYTRYLSWVNVTCIVNKYNNKAKVNNIRFKVDYTGEYVV